MHIFTILLLLSESFYPPAVEVRYFDIVHRDKVIGSLTATKTEDDNQIIYKNETFIRTRIVKEIEVNYLFEAMYINGELENAEAIIKVNDEIRESTITCREKPGYIVQLHQDKEKWIDSEVIVYSSVMLTFEEPAVNDKSFSEKDGNEHQLMPMGEHSYKKINSKGQENSYYYEGGDLKWAKLDAGIINFEIRSK